MKAKTALLSLLLVAVPVHAQITNNATDLIGPLETNAMLGAISTEAAIAGPDGLVINKPVSITVSDNCVGCFEPSGVPAWGCNGPGSACINATLCQNGGPAGGGFLGCLEQVIAHEWLEAQNGQICDTYKTTLWGSNGYQLADCNINDPCWRDMAHQTPTGACSPTPTPTPTPGANACLNTYFSCTGACGGQAGCVATCNTPYYACVNAEAPTPTPTPSPSPTPRPTPSPTPSPTPTLGFGSQCPAGFDCFQDHYSLYYFGCHADLACYTACINSCNY